MVCSDVQKAFGGLWMMYLIVKCSLSSLLVLLPVNMKKELCLEHLFLKERKNNQLCEIILLLLNLHVLPTN